jgi:FMN phosphatase YigB (HAD superfamily)
MFGSKIANKTYKMLSKQEGWHLKKIANHLVLQENTLMGTINSNNHLFVNNKKSVSNNSPLKGVIFDLDNVLYPKKEYYQSGIREISAWAAKHLDYDYGTSLMFLNEMLAEVGHFRTIMIERLVQNLSKPAHHATQLKEIYSTHRPDICCHSGVIPMLEIMRKPLKLGLFSSSNPAEEFWKIQALGLHKIFNLIHPSLNARDCATTENSFNWFKKNFKASSNELLYVGTSDSERVDVAYEAGWQTIMLHVGPDRRNRVFRKNNHRIITNVLEIEGAINDFGNLKAAKKVRPQREIAIKIHPGVNQEVAIAG